MAMKKVRLLVRYGNYANEVPPPAPARPWGPRLVLVAAAVGAVVALVLHSR